MPAPTRPDRARRRRALTLRRSLLAAAALAALGVLLGLVFAGSPTHLAAGVSIADVSVGGLAPDRARKTLEGRASALAEQLVTFTVGASRFRIRPSQLDVKVDWRAAVEDARRQGEGFGPFRGFRRLDVRFFGAQVVPPIRVYDAALRYELDRIARAVDRPPREAFLRLRGLTSIVVGARTGRVLDRPAAAATIVRSLASLTRTGEIPLPVRTEAPKVKAADLAPAAARVRVVLSAPVRLALGDTRYRLPRWRIAKLLDLPAGGRRTLRIGGRAATGWFAKLGRGVARAPRDASFAVDGHAVRVVPAADGLTLDAAATARTLLRAASRPRARIAAIAVVRQAPKLSTKEARGLGIDSLLSSYTTYFGGVANRIHNVELVSHLVDNHLIAPGSTFSFNQTTGDRTAAKGFVEAPVIINGELGTGLGGGVCQVSTTVFNAAYEAGLRIVARTNHALYISHYPQGRDATVNYPDTDLRFVNDTSHWLLLRTFVSSSTLTVSLYGAPQHRKVVSETAPLVETAAPPVKKQVDAALAPGSTVVDNYGQPARQTSVHRTVYAANGKLLYDDMWSSSYRAEPKLVRVGPAKPKPDKKKKQHPAGTTTGTTTATTTGPASTTPAKTPPQPPLP